MYHNSSRPRAPGLADLGSLPVWLMLHTQLTVLWASIPLLHHQGDPSRSGDMALLAKHRMAPGLQPLYHIGP